MWLLIPILFQLSEGKTKKKLSLPPKKIFVSERRNIVLNVLLLGQGVSKGLYRELFNFPLKDNPFFAKVNEIIKNL